MKMRLWLLAASLFLFRSVAFTQTEMPAEYKAVLDSLGKQGDFKESVLRLNIPRSDLHVVVDGMRRPRRSVSAVRSR